MVNMKGFEFVLCVKKGCGKGCGKGVLKCSIVEYQWREGTVVMLERVQEELKRETRRLHYCRKTRTQLWK